MKVFACGSTVVTKLAKIEGMITGLTIRFGAVAYEISYFNRECEYKQIWLNEHEFDTSIIKNQTIGYNK